MGAQSKVLSPQTYARVGGILYLFIIAAAGFAEMYVRGTLVVLGDPAATAANISSNETLFRLGLAGEMLTCVCDVTLAMILYVLLKPVNKNLALLGALFRLAFVAFYSVTKLFEIQALVALGQGSHLASFEAPQLHTLAYMAIKVHSLGYGASFLFFGICCGLFGYLISRSGYFPILVGVLLAVGGVGYVVFSLAQIVSPGFAGRVLFPWLLLPAFVGELTLSLWLTFKGVHLPTWEMRNSPS